MGVRIVTDSSCDMTSEFKGRVDVIPMTVRFGETEYIDGVTIDHKEFYRKLEESRELPATSQISPSDFNDCFQKTSESGDEAVVITLASAISGTYGNAVAAAENYKGIYIVDSGTCTVGAGILAERALSLANGGLSAKEIFERLETEKEKIIILALVDTLEYLMRGGRLSKTKAFAGTLLNIKPVIRLKNGVLDVLGKARGLKQGNNLLTEEIKKSGGVDFTKPVLLGYSGNSDAALRRYVEDSRQIWENELKTVRSTVIGSVIGTHVGPGAVAVAFFAK